MKQILILVVAFTLLATPSSVLAKSKLEKRYEYTLRNLKLDKQTEAKFAPILKAYLTEKKACNDPYDDLKDKYKAAEKAGTITDGQAKQLLDAKFEAETKELAVKKKYYAEFAKILKMKKVWYAFDLSNDKMSKIEGRDKDNDD
ncbi:MAG: hypothetical protein IKO85_01430 [Bacteroidaceae bacterium]|nr:hypothetical protein [Bacteroidaceae bacterium]